MQPLYNKHNFVIAGIPGVIDILFQLTSDLHSPTPTFTLTCVSNGGPVTYVNWTRDGIPVPQNRYLASHTLVNTQVATYHSTLSITGRLPGLYRCEVSSVRPDHTVMDTQDLDIVGELVLQTILQYMAVDIYATLAPASADIYLQVPTLLLVSLHTQLVPPASESPGLHQPQETL